MRPALVALLLAGCHDELVEPWQLDHDRIVAARAEPAGIVTGEVALLDGLVAHAGAVTTEPPTGATAPDAPAGLFTAVHFLFDHWQIDAPDAAQLAAARSELGLPVDAAVPLDVTLVFGSLVAQKRVWLGESRMNPALPAILVDGAPAEQLDVLDLAGGHGIALSAAAPTGVTWLSSIGTLHDASAPQAVLDLDAAPASGELVVVIRDGTGGMVWHVWTITTH